MTARARTRCRSATTDTARAYDVYGLRLQTNRPLPHLIESVGEHRREGAVRFELEREPETTQDGLLQVSYGGGEQGILHFTVDPTGERIWARWGESTPVKLENDVAGLLLGPILGGVARLRGTISLHAGVVVVDDRAVVMLGGQGAGKSTVVAALAQAGHAVLSDDVAVLSRDHPGKYIVHPGYPRLRLGRAQLNALDATDAGPVMTGVDKRYVKLSTETTARSWRFLNAPLHVTTIFELHRSGANPVPLVEHMSSVDRLAALIRHTRAGFGPLPDDVRRRELSALGHLAQSIPIRRLVCPEGLEKIPAICTTIVEEAASSW